MRSELFDLLPQILDRIEVGEYAGSCTVVKRLGMGREKLRHGFAGMIACPILNDKDMLGGLRQDIEQEGGIAFRVEPPRLGFGEEASRKRVDEPKDLVRFAYATGRDFGLVSLGRPGVTQRTPLGKTGLIAEE